jgi:hypothetical protein
MLVGTLKKHEKEIVEGVMRLKGKIFLLAYKKNMILPTSRITYFFLQTNCKEGDLIACTWENLMITQKKICS